MLHLEEVRKTYRTGTFTQAALDGVTITFRDNEFVAVLGPSGSGKTTMLNIVGGLDHCDSGDLVIDQVSTMEYTDRDWDTYRNNRIGFVFQNYNLIPHQTVLANVELALTLSGVSKAERTERATRALEQVDLLEHMHKRPNQLSGGQMQRVAIARALINDPEILLADEPTGALDSKTGVQVMSLLRGIAKDRLVIMVTHNPELADEYANRIVSLRDGQVVNDTNPYVPEMDVREAKQARRTFMSFFTAITLSFTNLMTKKGRTLMTSFAGSIGIVGIATILALANGVNVYIKSVEEDTLSLYPLTIMNQGVDLTSMMSMGRGPDPDADQFADVDTHEVKAMSRMLSGVGTNDLASLKTFLDSEESGIASYVKSIQYSYSVTPQIFASGTSVRQVNPNKVFSSLGFSSDYGSSLLSMGMSADVFFSLPEDMNLVENDYEVLAGHWPENSNECILVVTSSGGIPDFVLYAMGLRDPAELEQMIKDLADNNPISAPEERLTFSYRQLMGVSFSVVNPAAFYEYDSTYEVWADRSKDETWMKNAVANGEPLKVAGVVRAREDATATMLSSGLYYPSSLTYDLIKKAAASSIVRSQLGNPEINIFSGKSFDDEAANPTMADFDFSSMLGVDQEALAGLFNFDFSGLSFSAPNLNFSSMPIPSVPPPDLSAMLSGMNLQINPEGLSDLIQQTLADYLRDTLGGISPIPVPVPTPTAPTTTTPSTSPTSTTTGPTDTPTGTPTGTPTDTPTVLPTLPTSLPTLPTSLPTELPTSLPTDFPILDDIAGSFSEWFAQPAVQAQFMTRLMGAVNTEQLTQQASQALAGYMQQTMQTMLTAVMTSLSTQLGVALQATMGQLTSQMSSAMNIDPAAFSKIFSFNLDPEQLTGLMMSMMNNQSNSLDSNLRQLGYADLAKPSSISIYPRDFQAKEGVLSILDGYNDRMKASDQEDKVITYTDIVGTLMTSVTDIIDKITAVLVAFVSISLVVSSIMIGVITYISVLERRKEIGILRALGASKRDIGNVFNAETLIVGFVAGVMGVLITILLTIIANPIVYHFADVERIARLPFSAAVALIAISMALTFLAGLIPSSAASRADPVEALRSE